MCKWPINEWTHLNKLKFFARKIRKEDPEFKWPIKDPVDIVEWECIKDKAETRRKYKTRQRYNQKAARMEAKWKQVQSEWARVQKILESSVQKLNDIMTDKVNVLYNRSYKALSRRTRKERTKKWN